MKSKSDIFYKLKQTKFFPLFKDFRSENICKINLSVDNSELYRLNLFSVSELNEYIQSKIKIADAKYGIGGYREERIIYQKSDLFGTGDKARTIHTGTDIWSESGTAVYSPYDAKVHSFKNNDNFKDYGPTIILEHQINGIKFHTLYGHLSESSLSKLFIHKKFKAGDLLATTGNEHENGNWPPHLHFQIIKNMNGYFGDYPGVIYKKEQETFFENCPDPKLILGV